MPGPYVAAAPGHRSARVTGNPDRLCGDLVGCRDATMSVSAAGKTGEWRKTRRREKPHLTQDPELGAGVDEPVFVLGYALEHSRIRHGEVRYGERSVFYLNPLLDGNRASRTRTSTPSQQKSSHRRLAWGRARPETQTSPYVTTGE